MFLVRIGHTASRVSLHRCYMLAGNLPVYHWGQFSNQPGVQGLDALAEARIAPLVTPPYEDSNKGSPVTPGPMRVQGSATSR
jgi:hypothetical protein